MSERLDPDAEMAEERIGQVVAGHRLERVIGVGGMAAVYEATSKKRELVALKILHPEMCRRPEIRKRFAQEATAAGLIDHPGIVRIFGAGEEGDAAFIIMELLEGEPLGTLLRRDGPLPIPRLLEVLDQVLDALSAAHEKGVIHRDLKPDNLFVTKTGAVKVLDFGVARVAEDVPGAYKTRTGITLGTVPFMSPEQALGKRQQVDQRSDLFSLGAMAFRIIARQNIHAAETDAEMLVAMASKPAPPLESVCPDAPPGLCALIDVALAFSKDSRYPSAKVMQGDVRALAEGKPPPYATKLRKAKEMATRVDLVAPTPTPAPVPTAKAEPGPPTRVNPAHSNPTAPMPAHVRAMHGLMPESRANTLEQPARASATAVQAEEDEAPPSSQWPVLAMETVDHSDVAKTIPLPARDFEPPPVKKRVPPGSDKTLVSAPAPEKSAPAAVAKPEAEKTSRAPIFLFAVVLALVSGGVVYYFSSTAVPPAPPAAAP